MEEKDKRNNQKKEARQWKFSSSSSSDQRKRSPLQELQRSVLPSRFNRNNNKNGSIPSSSSSTFDSIEPHKACLCSLLSSHSNPSFMASHLQKKPASFARTTFGIKKSRATTSKSAPNLVNSKPSSLKSKKNPSFFLPQKQSGRKPISKTTQRSKLLATLSNSVKRSTYGSNQEDLKREVNHEEGRDLGEPTDFNFRVVPENLIETENFTPLGKLACGPSLNFAVVDDNNKPVGEDSNSANTTVKTPPVEASLSPEIQFESSNVVVGTPVCYGDGHLISGVTDKRKCRPRGILTIGFPSDSPGFGGINAYEDHINENDDDSLLKSRNSLIPLPAEASMRWLVSPLSNEDEVLKDDSSNSCSRPLESASICVPSSPSSYCRFSCDFMSGSGERNETGTPDATASTEKTRIVLLSPRRVSNRQGLLESPSVEKDVDSSATTQVESSCRTVCFANGGDSSCSLMGEKVPASIVHSRCSKFAQTPNSDTSSDRPVCVSTSNPNDVRELKNNLDICPPWMSDTTLGTISLSQMRISWREELESRVFDIDELDCCRCLSDEDNTYDDDDGCDEFPCKSLQNFGIEEIDSGKNIGLRSPEFLEAEPQITRKEKEPKIFAESISTDAVSLFASGDSDWAVCYTNHWFPG